jgi:hypothetical protein
MNKINYSFNKCKKAYIGLLVLATSVIAWNIFMYVFVGDNWVKYDPFNVKVFEWNWLENCCSWWPLLHLFSFTILGFLFPECWFVLFIGGILWEIIEVVINYIIKGTLRKQPMKIRGNVQYSEIWWAGSIKDIFFNGLGILIGSTLRKLVL